MTIAMMMVNPLLLLLIHLLCCTLARLTIRVGGAIAVALALPKQKTHKTATLARHRLHHINELVFLFFSLFYSLSRRSFSRSLHSQSTLFSLSFYLGF
jgi:hypothetical protein